MRLGGLALVCGQEIRSYLGSPMAYVVTAIFLLLSGTGFTTYLVRTGYSDTSIQGFVGLAPFLIMLFSAMLTMRLIAEERKLGTWELLMTAPVTGAAVVLGKYLASFAVLAGMLILTLCYPVLLVVFGDPDLGAVASGYLGLLLLGSTALAVGIFASSVTANQILAVVLATGILFALWFVGPAADFLPGAPGLLEAVSLAAYFSDFARGIVDTRAVVYYVSVAGFFLFLAVRAVEAEGWR